MASSPAPAEGALAALRRATSRQHATIDALVRLDALGERDRYVTVLAVFDGFFEAWEPAVGAALARDRSAWLAERSRRPFLARDMRALGARPIRPAGALADRLRIETTADAIGSLYVIEGSALGGQLIAKHVARELGIGPDNGGAFFAGWGARTGRRWREFRDVLASELASPYAVDRACTAAVATFDALIDGFTHALESHAR